MRDVEYRINCKKSTIISKILLAINKIKLRQYIVKLGSAIYPNTLEKGLTLWHYGSSGVHKSVKGGKYVTLQSGVNISENVTLGNDVYFASDSKIIEIVSIANGVIIRSNAVVTKNILEENTTWVDVPEKLYLIKVTKGS